MAWEAVAESENLPPAQIEEARKRTAEAFEEMRYRGRNLVICMLPSGARWSISCSTWKKTFSVLPQEISDRSLAFDLLRAIRLSLRKYEKRQRRKVPSADD